MEAAIANKKDAISIAIGFAVIISKNIIIAKPALIKVILLARVIFLVIKYPLWKWLVYFSISQNCFTFNTFFQQTYFFRK